MSGEPWYPVGPHDVFPEEFETFLLRKPACARPSCATTPTCSSPAFWQQAQKQVASGAMVDFWPYPEEIRFGVRYGGDG